MGDEEFIRYCESHCTTDRAGFVPQNITRILSLAGEFDLAAKWEAVPKNQIFSIGPDAMLPMCEKARNRMQVPTDVS
jgi:hypothetical protein